jgi:hypothetical protein
VNYKVLGIINLLVGGFGVFGELESRFFASHREYSYYESPTMSSYLILLFWALTAISGIMLFLFPNRKIFITAAFLGISNLLLILYWIFYFLIPGLRFLHAGGGLG